MQPKPRLSLRLAVQLGAGLLVPLWVAPALAQGVAITPSLSMAPRDEREKLAPAVMAPAASEAMRAEQTSNQLAWRESLKRMSEAEADDPSRALAAYKWFFVERMMSPVLGVQVGLKIAQLRLKLGDSQGALQTCEVLATKYADEPSAVLLSLEKARVLMGQKQLAEASDCVNEVMPELVALGPSRYREISDLLLQLVQANLDSDDADGKERAKALCVGVEEIYLRWTKKDAVDHLWQRFEALQVNYQQAGDEKRAEELLPKVGDALLKVPVERGYFEGSVLSLEAARYFTSRGQTKDAKILYQKVSIFGDALHTGLSIYDQAATLINQGKNEEARQLLNTPFEGRDANRIRVALMSLQALSYYQTGEFEIATRYAQRTIAEATAMRISSSEGLDATIDVAEEVRNWSDQWSKAPIRLTNEKLHIVLATQKPNEKTVTRHLFVRTLRDVPLIATVDDKLIQVRITGNKQKSDYFVQTELVIEVPPSLSQSINTTLMVSSPDIATYQAKMPLQVEVPELIRLSSSSVFFGGVKANELATRKFTLSAAVPFRVVDVKADSSALKVQSPAPQSDKEQIITLVFTSPKVGRFYNGVIRIQTDVPNNEVINIPYNAYVG